MKYQIQGNNLPVVICELEQNESMVTQDGGMSWMSPNMEMTTTTNGGFKKAFGRMFSGAKMFQNIYTARETGGMIAFASDFPGSIRAFDISADNEMVLQKRAFLASESGVKLDVFFQKKIFGGEGLFNTVITGPGRVWLQTMPLKNMAEALMPYMPQTNVEIK